MATESDRKGRIEAQVNHLRVAVIALAIGLAGLAGWVAVSLPGDLPAELAVERLNIVEPDGQIALALANSQRVPVATIDGQVLMGDQHEERNVPAIIFFDGKGDEVGGMLFGVEEAEGGYSAVRHFSLDGYKQDQTVVLFHYQNPQGANAGLRVSDRPADLSILEAMAELGLEAGATRSQMDEAIMALPEDTRQSRLRELFGVGRIYMGSNPANTARLELTDGQGRPRIRIQVTEDGEPSITILDEEGEVAVRLP